MRACAVGPRSLGSAWSPMASPPPGASVLVVCVDMVQLVCGVAWELRFIIETVLLPIADCPLRACSAIRESCLALILLLP